MFTEIMTIITSKLDDALKLNLVSKVINKELFGNEDVIQCTGIPFVFDNEIQVDYEHINMSIVIKKNVMEFIKNNLVTGTWREVKKETFVRNVKRYMKAMEIYERMD